MLKIICVYFSQNLLHCGLIKIVSFKRFAIAKYFELTNIILTKIRYLTF